MNDHEAMDAISATLDEYYRIQITAVEALHQIARITGENTIEHMEAKEQK